MKFTSQYTAYLENVAMTFGKGTSCDMNKSLKKFIKQNNFDKFIEKNFSLFGKDSPNDLSEICTFFYFYIFNDQN